MKIVKKNSLQGIFFSLTLFLLLQLTFQTTAWGYNFYPSSISIDPTGKTPPPVFTINNTDATQRPIQVTIKERKMDEFGKEEMIAADNIKDIFVVYPNQFILEGNQQRQIRVIWKGDKKPSKELCYRIIVEELPVELKGKKKEKEGQIKMLLRYISSVYITPEGAKPQFTLHDIKHALEKEKDKEKGKEKEVEVLQFSMENVGTQHFLFQNTILTLQGVDAKGESVEQKLNVDDLPTIQGQNILTGGKRNFSIPWPKSFDPQKASAIKIDIKI